MQPLLKTILRGIGFILLLTILGLVVQSGGLGGIFNQAWIDTNVRGAGAKGEIIFLFCAGFLVAVGLPRQIVSFLSGYAFGFFTGACLALAATGIGCILSFNFARFLGKEFITGRFPVRLKKADNFLKKNTFAMTLLIRLFPLGSNFVTNLAAGVSSASATGFLVGSLLGYIPQTLIFSLLGSGINLDPVLRITSSVFLFVFSAALGVYLYRRYRHGKYLNGTLE